MNLPPAPSSTQAPTGAAFVCDDALDVISVGASYEHALQGVPHEPPLALSDLLAPASLQDFRQAFDELQVGEEITLELEGVESLTALKLWHIKREQGAAVVSIFPAPTRTAAQQTRWSATFAKASHDLKAPLRKVITFAQLLERQLDLEQGSKQQRYLNTVSQNAQYAQDLVRAAVAYTRVMQRPRLRRARLLMSDLLEHASDKALGLPDELELAIPAELYVSVDVELMATAIAGLIHNAVAFCPPERACVLTINVQSKDDRVEVCFEDNGRGISPDELDRAFEPFYGTPPARDVSTYGLGLSYAQEVARAHGGRVTVQAREGQGARVRLVLPATD